MLSLSPYQGQLFFNTTEYNKLCVYNGSSWQAIGSTYQAINAGSATLIKGQPVQITVNADGVTQIIALGSVVCNGLVCFENVTEGNIVTVATDGVWDFRCDAGTYVTGQYLHTNTTGNWIFTSNAGLEVFGVIMEDKTLSGVGYVRGLLHTRPR